jgi:integrase
MDPSGSIFERVACPKAHEHIKKGKKKCPTTWWARVRYLDPERGQPKDLQRRAESRTDAIDKRDALLKEIRETAGRCVGSERMSFAQLCAYYEDHYVKEAEYVEGRKVSGLRSWYTVKKQLEMLKDHFGVRPIRSITYGNIRQFRFARFKAKTKAGTQRSIASVNRELALLRRMLNVAVAESWLPKNPFHQGASLISSADEKKRERILTQAEEKTLLDACAAPRRGHLRAIIIAALDTGCRRGELLKLRWRDVDLESGQINIIAFNTKTAKARCVAMTTRLRSELQQLWAAAPDEVNKRVFGVLASVKRSFAGARADAGLPDVRFNHKMHTAATRLLRAAITLSEVGRILGHQQPSTTYRYVNADIETANRAAAALDRFNALPLEAPINQQSDAVN